MFDLIIFKGASVGDWLQFGATISSVIIAQMCTLHFINKQIKANKKNAIDAEIYLEKYRSLNSMSNEILKVHKNMIYSAQIFDSINASYSLKLSKDNKFNRILSNDDESLLKKTEKRLKSINTYYSNNNYILNNLLFDIDSSDIENSKRLSDLVKKLFNQNEQVNAYSMFIRDSLNENNKSEIAKQSYYEYKYIKEQTVQKTPKNGLISIISKEIQNLKEKNKKIK